ncbi:MAG: RdgB/HAM1 family non-canonical purine NTP pyrophosphatase [Armatimonadetes bacterium]|nr:RdgB/HAM1 family non-canonical purine NTP pyrophosphatase [Armatimonadota bacterium]
MLVVATRNQSKASEMVKILSELLGESWEVRSLADYPDYPEPEETGDSYAANAKIKAEAAAGATNERCIADDAGLEIDALGGAPGLHSKRFGGEDLPFPDKIRIILERLDGKERDARFRCAVAISEPEGPTMVFESVKEGSIAQKPAGERGFGYDSIFHLPELNCTFAQIEPDHKNAVSHRGIVLAEAAQWLRNHDA